MMSQSEVWSVQYIHQEPKCPPSARKIKPETQLTVTVDIARCEREKKSQLLAKLELLSWNVIESPKSDLGNKS